MLYCILHEELCLLTHNWLDLCVITSACIAYSVRTIITHNPFGSAVSLNHIRTSTLCIKQHLYAIRRSDSVKARWMLFNTHVHVAVLASFEACVCVQWPLLIVSQRCWLGPLKYRLLEHRTQKYNKHTHLQLRSWIDEWYGNSLIKAQSLVKQNTNRKSNTKYNTYKCTQTTKIVINWKNRSVWG